LGMPTSVSYQIFKTLLFILFPISIEFFRRGTPCISLLFLEVEHLSTHIWCKRSTGTTKKMYRNKIALDAIGRSI